MLRSRMISGIVVGLLVFSSISLFPCTFTITNDESSPILIVDPRGSTAVYIQPGSTGEIDPTVVGWFWRLFQSEKLNFYVQDNESGALRLAFRLTEKYCTKDYKTENALPFSEIKRLVGNPTDRLTVTAVERQKHVPHEQKHSH